MSVKKIPNEQRFMVGFRGLQLLILLAIFKDQRGGFCDYYFCLGLFMHALLLCGRPIHPKNGSEMPAASSENNSYSANGKEIAQCDQ